MGGTGKVPSATTIATLLLLSAVTMVRSELTPPYFNLAEGRKITASATCGVGTDGDELYCKLVGANTENDHQNKYEVIQGQVSRFLNHENTQINDLKPLPLQST